MNEEELIQTLADALREKGFSLITRVYYSDTIISLFPKSVLADNILLKEQLNDLSYALLKLKDKL